MADKVEKVAQTDKMKKRKLKGKPPRLLKVLLAVAIILLIVPVSGVAAAGALDVNINGDTVDTIQILLMLTLITLLPSILIMMTCYTRIIIVLSFLRNALGLQQTPPNQVLIGIALFLSLFIMSPVISEINETAYQPYEQQLITEQEFMEKAEAPLKSWMLKQTKTEDLDTFVRLSKTDTTQYATVQELPLTVVIPAFITTELKRAFLIGFLIFIPFLIIDMIVSSTLMSMGMIMLPPAMISMPFKLLLFVLLDGWGLLFKSLAVSFK